MLDFIKGSGTSDYKKLLNQKPQYRESLYLVVGCLREADTAFQLVALLLVAGGLAAPRTAVGIYASLFEAYHGTVIVEQHGSLDMFAPQPRVGTLPRAALPKEQYCPSVIYDAAAVYGHRAVRQCHQAIAYP